MSGPRILIVDDDTALLEALPETLRLRMRSVQVDTSESPQVAFNLIAAIDYDAIISDIKMPGIDGLAVLTRIRAVRPQTPTLLITGHGEHDVAIRALRAGAYDLIQKPIDRDYLIASLHRAIEMHRLARQVEEQQQALGRHAVDLERIVDERTCQLREANEAKDRLLASEQAARAEAEQAQRRLAFLAEASNALAASLEYAVTLQTLARLMVPILADWSIVHVIDEGQSIRPVAVAHVDPAKEELAFELHRRYLPNPPVVWGDFTPAPGTTQSHVVREVTDESLVLVARDAEQLQLLRALGPKSYMILPLTARGRTFGIMTLVLSEPGRQYGVDDVALAEEVARRAAMAVDNARLYRDVQASVQARDEFLASISHDLKTPVASVKGRAQLLYRRASRLKIPGIEPILEGLASIDATASKMTGQINELLDVTRLQMSGRLDLDPTPTDLVALTRAVVADHEQVSHRHRFHLQAVTGELIGRWDAARLERVLANLLSNAIKYSPNGGEITVTIAREEADDRTWAVLAVHDQGLGIPVPDLPRVFERFQRGRNVRNIIGTGVGLSGARQIVELHGGTITVESQEGTGSTFTIRLPLAATTAGADPVATVTGGSAA